MKEAVIGLYIEGSQQNENYQILVKIRNRAVGILGHCNHRNNHHKMRGNNVPQT